VREELLALALQVRREAERRRIGRWHLCCMTCSVALAAVLEHHGYAPRIVQGSVLIDRPSRQFGETILHHWVEVSGFDLDVTADQFNGHVAEPLDPVRVMPVGSDPRYMGRADADSKLMSEIRRDDDIVHGIVSACCDPVGLKVTRRQEFAPRWGTNS